MASASSFCHCASTISRCLATSATGTALALCFRRQCCKRPVRSRPNHLPHPSHRGRSQLSSGKSVGDATFFGRKAGIQVANQNVHQSSSRPFLITAGFTAKLYTPLLPSLEKCKDVIRTLKPGTPGTKGFLRQYGQQLVAIRYRNDPLQQRCLTTIEIIVEEKPLSDSLPHSFKLGRRGRYLLPIHVAFEETDLRERVKSAGGKWEREYKVWLLQESLVIEMGLYQRIVQPLMSKYDAVDINL